MLPDSRKLCLLKKVSREADLGKGVGSACATREFIFLHNVSQ